MDTFAFSGLGTHWTVGVDGGPVSDAHRIEVLDYVARFERRFSRFLAQSEVNAFRRSDPGSFEVSRELAEMLERAQWMKNLTEGLYDPVVSELLEMAGYDSAYRFLPEEGVRTLRLPKWSIEGTLLTIDGPAGFDLGGIGKGYCIDRVSGLLTGFGYPFHMVEGGGDIFATSKADESPYRVALQWPGKPDTAFGTVDLHKSGLAASDSHRRRWGRWHHILNPRTRAPVDEVLGCCALSKSAWDADTMTSLLFLSQTRRYPEWARIFHSEYAVFLSDRTFRVSSGWRGDFF